MGLGGRGRKMGKLLTQIAFNSEGKVCVIASSREHGVPTAFGSSKTFYFNRPRAIHEYIKIRKKRKRPVFNFKKN